MNLNNTKNNLKLIIRIIFIGLNQFINAEYFTNLKKNTTVNCISGF